MFLLYPNQTEMSIWILGTHIFQHLFSIAYCGDLSRKKKGVRENVASIFQNINYNVLLRTYGLVNLNLRTKEPEFQFSCVAKDCLAFPDKLWVSGPPLLNKGLHSLRLPEIYRTTIVPFSINTPLVSIVWHDEQHSKLAEREMWLVRFDESEEKRSEVGENWR